MKNTLKYAPHYDEIVGTIFSEEDFISKRIIDYYQEYLVGTIKSNNRRVRNLDKVVYEYFYNIKFNKYAHDYLEELEDSNDGIDYYNNLDINLPKLYKFFEKNSLELVNGTKWL